MDKEEIDNLLNDRAFYVHFYSEDDALVIMQDGFLADRECIKAIKLACEMHLRDVSEDRQQEANDAIEERFAEHRAKTESTAQSKEIGNLYLCRHERHGFTKIGYSISPKLREATLQAEDPLLRMVEIFQNASRADERWLHQHFKEKRKRGEWFELTESDIDKIRRYMNATLI